MGKRQHEQGDKPSKKDRKKHKTTDAPAAEQPAAQPPASLAEGEYGSRVDDETVGYLNEVSAHFKTLYDAEERSLLLDNVLEEVAGKEVEIATDAVTSRLLEALLAGASAAQLVQFMQAFADEDNLYRLAGR